MFGCKSQGARCARMAELADAPDLGSGGAILGGSSPSPGNLLRLTSYREKNIRRDSLKTLVLARAFG